MPLKAPVRRLGPGAAGLRRCRYRPGQRRLRPVCRRPLLLHVERGVRDGALTGDRSPANRPKLWAGARRCWWCRAPAPDRGDLAGRRALSRRGLAVEYREPDGRHRRVGPVDPVATVRGDIEPVAGTENAGVGLVLEPQPCGAGEDQYPFALRLIIPEPGRARLTP